MKRLLISLLFCFISSSLNAQVVFDAKTATWGTTTSGTSLTINNLTVGSGSNRVLVLTLLCGSCGTALPTGLTLTWDNGGTNQALTQITGTLLADSVLSATTALYGLIAPTSGNKTLLISWTGANEMHASAASFTGVNQTSIAIAFPHGTTNSGNSTGPSTVTITSVVGNMVIANHAQNFSTWGALSGTTIATDVTGPNLGEASNYNNGAATVTMTAAFTSGTGPWVSAGTDILAASGGVTPSDANLSILGVGGFLLKRDLDYSNDNDLMFINKVA